MGAGYMVAIAAAHGVRPRVRRVALEELPAASAEMDKGHMRGRTVVVME